MKLSKSIIVTGLLFSSILGGVNVNNIVSHAASSNTTNSEVSKEQKVSLNINFQNVDNSPVDSKVNVLNKKQDLIVSNGEISDWKSISIPVGYSIVNVSKVTNGSITVTLKEKTESFKINYVDENNKKISEIGSKAVNVNIEVPSKSDVANQIIDLGDKFLINDIQKDIAFNFEEHTVTVKLVTAKVVKVNYVFDKKIIGTENVKIPSTHQLTNEDLTKFKDFLPTTGYTVKKDNTVEVSLIPKEVQLAFLGTNVYGNTIKNDFKAVDKKLSLTPDKNKSIDLQIKLPENYRLKNPEESVKIENGKIQVKVEKTKSIKVNFEIKNDRKTTLIGENIILANDAPYVKASEVKIPSGYELVNNNYILFGKDGKSITVIIKKTKTTNGSANHNVNNSQSHGSNHSVNNNQNHSSNQTAPTNKVTTKDFKGTVATTPGQYVTLYNAEGKAISGRRLAGDSNWAADKTMVRDGVKYYRVATNEWVKASDVYEYTASNAVVETAAGNYKKLFDSKGNIVSNRGLAAGTKWMTDKTALIQGEKMYRVATNEWLKVSDVK